MVYEHRTYYILPGKMAEFVQAFGSLIVPLIEKYGANLVGAWQIAIGQSNEFVYILGFEDMAQLERFWPNLRQDDQFKKYQQAEPRVAYVVSKILQPAPYSPLK